MRKGSGGLTLSVRMLLFFRDPFAGTKTNVWPNAWAPQCRLKLTIIKNGCLWAVKNLGFWFQVQLHNQLSPKHGALGKSLILSVPHFFSCAVEITTVPSSQTQGNDQLKKILSRKPDPESLLISQPPCSSFLFFSSTSYRYTKKRNKEEADTPPALV